MNQDSKIYVAGHKGLVGSAILRSLQKQGYTNIVCRTSSELDLRNQDDVERFFQIEKPEYVFLAAATVGGIMANNIFPADFIFDNIAIQNNVIHSSFMHGVKKLLFLGSSCIYPKMSPQPIKEDYLLTGMLEATNEAYAIAKIAGIKLCQSYEKQYGCNFISVMPTNLYGPGDNYHLQNAHVLPALIRKFYEATKNGDPHVTVWGTGTPRREFLYVDDLANACIFLMHNYNDPEIINIGAGQDISIKEVAYLIQELSCYQGKVIFDETKPDGTPRKLLCIEKIQSLGWAPSVSLREGLSKTVADFIHNYDAYIKQKNTRSFAPSTRFEAI